MESQVKSTNTNKRRNSKIIKPPEVQDIEHQRHQQITEYTNSPSKKQFLRESDQQRSSRKSITPIKSRQANELMRQSEQSNHNNNETEQRLITESNDLLPINFEVDKQQLMHQNTGIPMDKSSRQRELIDNLVDDEKKTQRDCPINKIDNTIKKSIENSKSNFVLETNKSVKSNSMSERKRSDSNLNLSQNSSQQSDYKNNQPHSMNSFSSKFKDGETINQHIENQTLLAVLGESEFLPEAMPIYRRISFLGEKEPEFWQRLRNRNRNMNQQQNQADYKEACTHEEVENWKCKECHTNIARFNHVFDDNEGKVVTPTKIVYENSFLDDFRIDFISQYNQMIQKVSEKKPPSSYIIYNAYQPGNIAEFKEYMFYLMCKRIKKKQKRNEDYVSPFGDGMIKNLSHKLCKFIMTNDDKRKFNLKNNHLWFDSIFESGNLLQAQRSLTEPNTYNLFMQVDTNTRGHQQWFYFRVKGGLKNKEYTFRIMNFTKPGVTGGRGYKTSEYEMRIHYKSKQREKATDSDAWQYLTHETCQCEYKKTNITRRKKDVIAAGADSDQEEWVEEAFQNQPVDPKGKQTEFAVQIPESSPSLNRQDTGGVKEKPKKRKVFYYYALQFKYKFEFDDDTVQFAFAKPITFSEIMEDIHNKERILMPKNSNQEKQQNIQSPQKMFNMKNPKSTKGVKNLYSNTDQKIKEDPMDPGSNVQINPQSLLRENQFIPNLIIDNPQRLIYYQRTELCRTMSGIPLYKIIISRDQKCQKKNQIVLITSRVHSGETPGSEVFRGIFDFIISDCREARYLRRFYTFVLIPIMNPDGVICGNYRNSVAGVDLNRQWINPEPLFHPEVLSVKNLMQQIKEEDKRQIWIYCDIHGHSKKKNSFFYGCNTAANGGFLSWTIVRLLPRILAQKTHMFNYKDSRFRVEAYKIGTARVVAWKQFQITHSFTLENSFFGYEVGEGESKCFTQEDYKDIGLKFTMAIYDMHFLWKDIKRELRITQGWLKPRTLYELTGVPLAQKVAEEAAAAKEQIRKQIAIQQYEEYLKTFYNNKQPLKRHTNFVPRNINIQQLKQDKTRNSLSNSKMLSEEIGIREQKDRKMLSNKKLTLDNGQLNEDLQEAMNQDNIQEEEMYYYLHRGLVKIQACWRGFLARKQVQSLLHKSSGRLISNNENVKNNFYEVGSDAGHVNPGGIQGEEILQRSNTDQMNTNTKNNNNNSTNPIEIQLDTSSQGTTTQNLSIFGGKTFNRPKLDWREFFNRDELDKAYQIVEVEQRDESDNDDQSMGSHSNPSEDNLEEEQMYEQVYCIQNPKLFIQSRQKKIEMFIQKIQGNQESTASDQNDIQKPKPREILSESKGILKDKELAERKHKSAFPRRSDKNVINKSNLNQHSHDDDSYALTPIHKDKEAKQQLALNSSQKNFLRKNWQNNMMNRSSQSPIINKEITQENVFYHQTTQNQVATNPVRMIQQSYLKQQGSHKKENINQVIKDCFITKKMNTKSAHSNSNNLFSKQNQGMTVNQSGTQWAPYQNNNAQVQASKTTGFNPQNRKQLIKSQGNTVNQNSKQVYGSPKKTGWQSKQQQMQNDQMYPEIQMHSFYPSHDNMFQEDQNSLMMHHLLANTQYQMTYNQQMSKQNERQIIKAQQIKGNPQIGAHLQSNELHKNFNDDKIINNSIPMINNNNQLNFSFNSNKEKIPMNYMHQDLKGQFQINPQPTQIQSNNNLRGINSISVLQKEAGHVPHQKMTPQYDSQEYRQGMLKMSQHQKQYIVQNNQIQQKTHHPKSDQIKKTKSSKHPAKVNPRSFMVTSGLITDHKEGLNSLFVTGKSEHSIPTQISNVKKQQLGQSQQQQVTNLQSVRNLVEQILLGPVKLSDQQQIQLQIKQNPQQFNDGGVQQFVNINQFNMFCSQSQSRETNQNNMKAMVQSSDGPIIIPQNQNNNNMIVTNKFSGSKSQNMAKSQNQPFSQQQNAQIQSIHLQQPRGALHMQHQMPQNFIQPLHPSQIQHSANQKGQYQIHNKFGHYGMVKNNKINKLEAQDKIPVGLQSLMNGVPSTKPPVSAVSRHSSNLISSQQQYSQQQFSKQNRAKDY